MAERKSMATWEGSLKEGKGTMRVGHNAYEGPYSFKSRFEEGEGTNPEELVAAAHAGCFSMDVSARLGRDGVDVESVETTALVELRMVDNKPTITRIGLTASVNAPGADEAKVREVAEAAKDGCVIGRALAGVETIDLDLTVST